MYLYDKYPLNVVQIFTGYSPRMGLHLGVVEGLTVASGPTRSGVEPDATNEEGSPKLRC